jgi:hypothetical protein
MSGLRVLEQMPRMTQDTITKIEASMGGGWTRVEADDTMYVASRGFDGPGST